MSFPINPPNAPITNGNGTVTREWYLFFLNLQKTVGGPSDPFVDTTLISALPAPAPVPAEAVFAPGQAFNDVPEPLTPPVQFIPADDLLYPPRYGA